MKAYVEGMRSLLYYIGHAFDKIKTLENEAEKERLSGIIDLLIPVAQGLCERQGL